jgi:DNA polymerase
MWTERQIAMMKAMGLRSWTPSQPASLSLPSLLSPPELGAALPAVAEPDVDVPVASPAVSITAAPPSPASAPRTVVSPQVEVSVLDWPALRAAVADCRACQLCETRKQTVFGVGHPQARWMVIGEAPGAQEDEQGEPFVGAAGQLLDGMLRALKLSRADDGDAQHSVYIANTLKCRPPGNRNPQPEEMARCEAFLLRQIALVRPKVILAMGRFAVQTLLRSQEPIGRLRGQVHHYQGVPLVVTYHPAYLLRNLPEKARAWEDLCLAASIVEPDAR